MLDKLKNLVKEFEKVQSKYSDFGAYDSEPDWVFQRVIRKAFEKGEVDIPTDGYEWELYTASMDCEEAAKELHDKATEVANFVVQVRDDENVHKFIDEYCWR